MKTTLPTRFLLGAAASIALVISTTANAETADAPTAAIEAVHTTGRSVPVHTLVHRTKANSSDGIAVEEVRWGRRFSARYGPPYRGYYFNGPVRYPTYYPTARYYRAYRPQYPGYYGRGYYGNPWGGVRTGRYGVYWR